MACCVPFCNNKAIKGVSNFGIPKNDFLLNLWEKSLRMKLKPSNRICLNHFKHEDVIKTWESGQGLSKYTVGLFIFNKNDYLDLKTNGNRAIDS